MSDHSNEAATADFRRMATNWESELRQQFRLRGATSWGTQIFYDRPWYSPPLPSESKLFIFFFLSRGVELGHYCVPLRTTEVLDEPRYWDESFFAKLRLRSIDDEIPAHIFDWRAV